MSIWKCDICNKKFDNFHAQGFGGKIYCPLCFFKEENRRLKEKIDMYEKPGDLTLMFMYCDEKAKDKIKHLESVLKEIREYIKGNDDFYYGDELYESYEKILEIIDKGIGEDK